MGRGGGNVVARFRFVNPLAFFYYPWSKLHSETECDEECGEGDERDPR